VVESLRHLDTAIVLSLVRARYDYSPGMSSAISRSTGTITWVKQLEDIYSMFKGEILLPWEGRKALTILAFAESAKAGTSVLGPSSLRKSSVLSTQMTAVKMTKDGGNKRMTNTFTASTTL
jgi:hypothetical protein